MADLSRKESGPIRELVDRIVGLEQFKILTSFKFQKLFPQMPVLIYLIFPLIIQREVKVIPIT
jgi:hypothetical protein